MLQPGMFLNAEKPKRRKKFFGAASARVKLKLNVDGMVCGNWGSAGVARALFSDPGVKSIISLDLWMGIALIKWVLLDGEAVFLKFFFFLGKIG